MEKKYALKLGEDGRKQSITDTTWTVDNNYMIPECIYGIA